MRRRCLVIHPGALGDVLLAVPALGHLRTLGLAPSLAVTSPLVRLFDESGVAARALDLEALGLHRLFVAPPAPEALAVLAGYDAVVSWFGAGDPTYTAALGRLGRPVVLARAAPPPGARQHVSRHLVATLAPLGPVRAGLPDALLSVDPAEQASAVAWLAARGLGRDDVVVLQPGAGSPGKAWPGFGALARRLREAGLPVVALAGPADTEAIERLVAGAGLDEAAVARDWPLARIAALFTVARVAVGNDSGPTHLAARVGCPTVAVFGPTDPAVWAPLGRHVRVVAAARGREPWTGVSVEAVEAAVHALVGAPGAAAAGRARRA
jgi:ADP-heptose:LPS heptosyltransferase